MAVFPNAYSIIAPSTLQSSGVNTISAPESIETWKHHQYKRGFFPRSYYEFIICDQSSTIKAINFEVK